MLPKYTWRHAPMHDVARWAHLSSSHQGWLGNLIPSRELGYTAKGTSHSPITWGIPCIWFLQRFLIPFLWAAPCNTPTLSIIY